LVIIGNIPSWQFCPYQPLVQSQHPVIGSQAAPFRQLHDSAQPGP